MDEGLCEQVGLKRPLVFQGFLSDLLKKANRPYDEPKLQEYTQTIVSVSIAPSGVGYGLPAPGSFLC